jgi:ABC-2 type transport system ATP-binding protein
VTAAAGVEVTGLRVAYGATEVLHGLDFTVRWGEVCGYLGPNGAGKSTTLRALTGLIRPAGGTVRIAGADPADEQLEARNALGYVPDGGGLYQLLTPREHLWLAADLHELDPGRAEARITALSAQLELAKFLDRRIDTLSKGQRQRVALACGLVHEPKVLMLDEPLAGLDVHGVLAVRALVRELADAGGAVLYCSHLLDVVERLCDRTIVIAEGRIVADAPTAELVARAHDKRLESVFQALTRAEPEVREALAGAAG